MVEWSRKLLTGIIAVPLIFIFIRYRILFFLLSHGNQNSDVPCMNNLGIVYMTQTEYAKLVNTILKLNAGQAEHSYIDSMQSILGIVPGHLLFLLISFMEDDANIHLALFLRYLLAKP
jgi:hypothetical protein